MILYYAGIAFTIWMIVDAVRRRAEYYWYLIILFVPFGSVIYFAMVKVRDFKLRGGRKLFSGGKTDVERLRQRVTETPSLANKLELADALEQASQNSQASALYQEVLAQEPEEKQALHGLARCAMSEKRFDEAIEKLERLLAEDNAYRDYAAALDYAEALWQNGQREDTIEVLEGLVAISTRVNHYVALGHYLVEDGRTGRARQVLEQGLSNYDTSPDFVQRRDEKWARRAKKMLGDV